ncbi:hypothetical protein Kpol_1019p22 [Vanderwaltozyma polyspora DSM 70294]|uniref:CDP-diacylglycerol-glycerol-3-phosphate 3-phosphatidyltransferase n=1 Tax=Vanderwaltozyma polyspora (strain ATCC 22028 / DSM 70294 / BCRC 21397 / CBS 2163 / NBRC 10782 / NRRL Y-8283 / UCD 57-17) TaxID=436907 RepID=A7TPB5_VANPO|nr:uncharacterized protein Kpol_1019p22 [Vanderwaltozyma polyspora DSM 70294]EDO15902.1 hypothetical protein Kpol_1019p22 [Vanderwaltozyma polyspora DSM 70294]
MLLLNTIGLRSLRVRSIPSIFRIHVAKQVNRGNFISQRYYSDNSNSPQKMDSKIIGKKSLTLPNIITLSRIACAPFIGGYILTNNFTPAFYLFAYSCVTDFLDGYIARKYNLRSVAGTILDPMADKILMIVATASLALPPGPQIIPMSIASLILGRDALLAANSFFVRFTSMKQKYSTVTWKSYWDFFNFPSVEVKPTLISKWNTFLQMIYLGWGVILLMINHMTEDKEGKENKNTDIDKNHWSWWCQKGFEYMGYVVGITTVLSGSSYFFRKDTAKLL